MADSLEGLKLPPPLEHWWEWIPVGFMVAVMFACMAGFLWACGEMWAGK